MKHTPREPRPYWKRSHRAWYVKIDGKHHRLGKDEKAAWERYHALMAGRRSLREDPLVADLISVFLQWSEHDLAEDTHKLYKFYCISFLQSLSKNTTISHLKPAHLITWTDTNYPVSRYSCGTRRCAMASVQRIFNFAVQMGYIERNPFAFVKKPAAARRDAYLRPEQYKKLLEAIHDSPFRSMVEILRHTGCRPKEARIVLIEHFYPSDRCWILPAKIVKGKRKLRTILGSLKPSHA